MNCVDYFFEDSKKLKKNFLIGKEEIAFDVLYSKTERLAGYISKTVGEDKCVLLLSANNSFFIMSYLAIMKSGNTCVPLDPKIEQTNLDYIKKECDPQLAILTTDVSKRLDITWCEVVVPDDINSIVEQDLTIVAGKSFNKERIAEIIFTSGSTGTPKGVMLSHKNLIANTESIIEYLELSSKDIIMVVMPFFYCYGLSLFHTHLRVGGSMVLNNSFIFIGAVINDIKNHNCTGFAGVPSHFQILLRKSETFKNTTFSALRYVTQAGGKLSTVFIDEFRDAFPEIKFYVMYGQTEATARLSYLPPEKYSEKKGSLGKGIPGVQLRVVNKNGDSVKSGEIGEIIARGENVMSGYINDLAGTKEVLRDGWLFTGDLATVDEDGYIYHSARKKEIIKVGGKRISPKEIEDIILRLESVVDCTIDGVNNEVLGEAIKATVIVNNVNHTSLSEELIKNHCSKHLSMHKVPHFIEFKENMELSSAGKKVKAKL